jgi:uracil-DNA glycosylase
VCDGAAYQTPPTLYAGNHNAPIIALGQNPGQIKKSDHARQRWMKIFEALPASTVNRAMPAWYMWDFHDSPGAIRLAAIFGKDWLFKGDIMWSNAVRCRTLDNARPANEMVDACKTWTDRLIAEKKGIIMVGGVAKHQIMGAETGKLEWGAPKKHPRLGYILAIKHYSAWRGNDTKLYKDAVKRLKERVL